MTTAHRFTHRFVSLRLPCRRLSSVVAMVMALQIVLAQVASAANPPPVQIYYVPAPENQVFAALKGIYPGGAPNLCNSAAPDVASPINTYISVSIIAAGTILYYDQWEDDFEVDLAHPVQPTTQIWGDANQANGYPPGNPADILSPDSVVVLSNSVPVPRNPAQLFFDGGDKVGASRPIAMTRALWSGAYPDAPGTLLSDAVEIYDTGRWGTHYQAPVGATTAANQLFEYTGMAVMARTDGTEIAIDANADGAAELNATLAEGESYLVDGGMLAGATVEASAPVQVTLITGDRCDIYESRWYSLFPADRWSGSYYSPVGTPTGGGGTTLWVFNPESTPISVTWAISTGVQAPFNVPARGNAVVLVPNGSGAHLWTADTTPFQAIAAVGSDSISNTDNSRADWGFTLIPEALLTYQSLVGWGAGRDPTSSVNPQENGNPVWVTPIFGAGESGPAQICIDYDGNNDGPFTDAYGFHYDLLLVINALQSRQVFDPDGDQTGMVLYVCDPPSAQTGAELAATWGQAPGVASAGPPSLDLGTTAPPASTFETGKGAEIIPDGDGDGKADPGDRIIYSVIVRNASRSPLSAVSISDTVPAFTTYVTSTTTVNLGAGPQPVPDRTPGDPFPLDRGGVTLPGMPVLGVYTVTFTVLVNFPLPVELERIQNVATVRVGDDTQFPAVDTPVDLDAAVVIKKATNGFDADTVTGPILDVGAPVIWSYAITNTGTVTLAQVSVTDDRGVTPIRIGGSGNELGLGETWYYTAAGVAAPGQYTNTGTVTAVGLNSEPAQAADPSHYWGLVSEITLVKSVIPVETYPGQPVTYTYVAGNPGNAPLDNVTLVDDRCSPVLPINSDPIVPLAPGEQRQYGCTMTVTQDITNTAIVQAVDLLSRTVTATDTAFVDVRGSAMTLTKVGSARTVRPGMTVIYTYTVTNTGDDVLTEVQVVDDRCAPLTPITGGQGPLLPGEAWRFQCSMAIQQPTTNIATATAVDSFLRPLTATATWSVDLSDLYLPLLLKPADCPPPDGCPLAYTKAFAFDESRNRLYVTSRHPDQLLVVDPVYAQIMMTATTGLQPWGVVVNEATGRIYVGNFGSGDVWVYDSRTLTVLAKIPIGVNPTLLEILPDEDTVFAIARQESRIVVIQGLTKVQDIESGGSGPYGLAADRTSNLVYVSNRDSAHLATISKQAAGGWKAHSNLVFEDGRQLFGLAYHPGNGYVYSIYAMPDNTWYIDAWKPNNSALWGREATIVVPSGGALDSELVGGTGIVVSPKTGHVLNANTGADSVTVIDANTNRVSETIVVGDDPFPVTVDVVSERIIVGLRTPGRIVYLEDK